jgi:MoaA/NifB/PqqE/SkfB family radical SAM enzyme
MRVRLPWLRPKARERDLDAQLNVYNFAAMRQRAKQGFDYLRFDPNNNCNVHCVYCHNHRSADVVPTEDFIAFLHDQVRRIRNFQMGCIMEPTLDARMADLLLAVRRSSSPPSDQMILQTNGILLHRHNAGVLAEAGLTRLAVSIDAADAQVHKALRGGTSIAKVAGNLRTFHQACPSAAIHFITTVTRANLPVLDDLVRFGLDLGVSRFVLREMFYHPDSDVVDHARMPDLVLRPGEYADMAARLRSQFGACADFEFADEARLAAAEEKMTTDSLRRREP